MRGKKEIQPKLFYQFSLERLVPENNILRRLNKLLDLSFVEVMTRGLYGYNGNKSVDPVVVVKILLLGYLNNIRHVRELMRQISDRMSFRWFLGYDIDEPIPDHSAISKNLKRFGPELFRELFERTVQQCIHSGLVGSKLIHIDSTTVKADASESSVQPIYDDDAFQPDLAPQEYWDALTEEAKQTHPNVNERMASTTDPDAAIISRDGNNRMLAYKDHRAVDDQRGVILATLATSAAVTDEGQLMPVVQEVIFRQGVVPEAVAADTIYGKTDNYRDLTNMGIIPYISRQRAAHKKGQLGKEHFIYLPDLDCYRCPTGQLLKPQSERRTRTRLFRASGPACASCDLRSQCVRGKGPRAVHRHADEHYAERALANRDTPAFQEALKRRMTVIEGSFAEAKLYRAHARARWRGQAKMQIQCYLVAAAQNLKKLLTYAWKYAPSGVENGIIPVVFAFYVLDRVIKTIINRLQTIFSLCSCISQNSPIIRFSVSVF
jgi:transposase